MCSACALEQYAAGTRIRAVCDVQVLFSGDHLAADVVGEWTAKYEVMGDGFLGISRSFNCESFHSSLVSQWKAVPALGYSQGFRSIVLSSAALMVPMGVVWCVR